MTPLRGRETELARLEELADSLRAGAGGIVVVEGAAGIGKSRLLAEARSRAAEGDLLVAAGGADELDQVTPWAPLLGALGSSEPPVLASGALGSLRSLSDQRLAVIERMQAALERTASSRPVLIILDDLQWADTATLLALGLLPLSLFSYPVGWLLALRPLPASAALEGLLDRLAEAGATRLHLGPLPLADAVVLARDTGVPGSDADLGERIAGADGNPFYIQVLLKADLRRGLAEDAVRTVAQHLRSLSDGAHRLLQVASVLGREFSVAEVAVLTGQPSSLLLGAVEEALRAEMLVEVPVGLAFRHDLLREAVYDSLPASVRVALARTRKGRGFSEVEDREGWHGKPLPEPMAERAVVELGGERNLLVRGHRPAEAAKPRPAANGAEVKLPGYERGQKVATRKAYGDALAALGVRPNVVAMDGEVSNSTFADEFAKAYPERYFEMFIAEQQLIAAAVGIAVRGYRPFASTFAALLHRSVPQRRDQRRRPRPGHGRPGGHLLPADHPGRLPGAVRLRGDLPGRRVQGAAPDR